jgi:RimJ/RimL family protein N-acetyltransferase
MQVLLRETRGVGDAVLVMAWRNSPLIWQGLYTQAKENRPLKWDEHWEWWKSRSTWKIFIIQVNDGETTRDVGYLNIAQCDHWKPEIGISIGEVTLWGQGIAKKALLLGIEWLKAHGYKRVHTSILNNNERSLNMFKSVGFKVIGEARENETEVELWIK